MIVWVLSERGEPGSDKTHCALLGGFASEQAARNAVPWPTVWGNYGQGEPIGLDDGWYYQIEQLEIVE